MLLRYIVFTIWLIAFFLLPENVHSSGFKCPDSVKQNSAQCNSICSSIPTAGGYSLKASISGSNNSSQTIFSTHSFTRCVCLFDKQRDADDIPSDFRICEYLATEQKSTDKIFFAKTSMPSQPIKNLVNVVTFQPSNIGHPALHMASSSIANTYYKSLHYFTSYYALLLLSIVFGGTLFLFGASNFTQILKSPQGFWSLMTSTDFKSKSAQVIVAVAFFGLPVNIETVYIDDIKADNTTTARQLLKDDNATALCQDLYEEIRKAKADYDKCVIDETEKKQQEQQKKNNQLQDDEQPPIEDSATMCDTEYTQYLTVYNSNNQKCEERVRKEDNDTNVVFAAPASQDNNSIIIRRSIREGLQIPFATNVVAGFVNFGINASEKVAKWANESVKSYLYHQVVDNPINMTSSLSKMQSKLIAKNSQFTASVQISLQGCGDLGNASCEQISNAFYNPATTFQSAYCKEAMDIAFAMCARQTAVDAMFKNIQEHSETAKQKLQQRTHAAFSEIESNYSFLSPALLPMIAVTYPFASLQSTKTSSVSVSKIAEYNSAEMRASPLDVDELAHRKDKSYISGISIMGSIKDAWNFISGKATDITGVESTMQAEFSDIITNDLKFSHKFAYFHGYATILLSIPPASQIKQSLMNTLSLVGKAASLPFKAGSEILTVWMDLFPASKTPGPIASMIKAWSSVLGKMSAASGDNTFLSRLFEIISEFASSYIAVNIASLILFLLPFLAITIAGVVRFIHFLYEVAKLMITLPFYALPVATRKAEGVFFFFGDLIKLSVYPLLMAASVAFAIFFALTFQYFVFDMPLALLLSQISPSSYVALFVFGAMTAILQIVSTIAATYYLFKITMSFPDYILQSVSRILQMGTPSREYQSFGEATFDKMKAVTMAKI